MPQTAFAWVGTTRCSKTKRIRPLCLFSADDDTSHDGVSGTVQAVEEAGNRRRGGGRNNNATGPEGDGGATNTGDGLSLGENPSCVMLSPLSREGFSQTLLKGERPHSTTRLRLAFGLSPLRDSAGITPDFPRLEGFACDIDDMGVSGDCH